MLGNSVVVVVVVVRTRPRAKPLAVITMAKSTHGFPLFSSDKYGAPLQRIVYSVNNRITYHQPKDELNIIFKN